MYNLTWQNHIYQKMEKKKTIWIEFNKIINEKHRKFYFSVLSKLNFNFYMVLNKTTKKSKKIVAEKNYAKNLPRGISVICHQNF
jgi:hypothetical protein